MNETEAMIAIHEKVGRAILKLNLKRILKPETEITEIVEMPIECPVDISVEYIYKGKNGTMGIEVKDWSKCCTYMLTKDENGDIARYDIDDSFMLKSDKLKRMNHFSVFANYDYLLYCCMYNDYIYVYNVRDMEYSELPQCYNLQKKTQDNKDSDWVYSYTYFFPLSLATKKIKIGGEENETEN